MMMIKFSGNRFNLQLITLLIFLSSCSLVENKTTDFGRTPSSFSLSSCRDKVKHFFRSKEVSEKSYFSLFQDKVIIALKGKVFKKRSEVLRRRNHQALFETFLPKDGLTEYISEEELSLFSNKLFDKFSKIESLRLLHLVLDDLNMLAIGKSIDVSHEQKSLQKKLVKDEKKRIQDFIDKTNNISFFRMKRNEREDFLTLLQQSEVSSRRKLAKQIRMVYLASIYDSPLGNKITGYKAPKKVVDNISRYLELNTPHFKPSRVNFDKATNTLRDKNNKKFDYIVVGSGPAGSLIASELRAKGKSVLLVEQGSFFVPGALETRKYSNFREASGQRFSDDGSIIFRNGQVTGGGSAVNIDLAFSPELGAIQSKIKKWRDNGHIDNEQFELDKVKSAYQWVKDKVGTRTPSKNEINRNNQVLYQGAILNGDSPKLYDLNTFSPEDGEGMITRKKSSVEAFLIPALNDLKNPLEFIPDATVERVVFAKDGTNVNGIEMVVKKSWQQSGIIADPTNMNLPLNTKILVEAENVILSAGSIGSPTLLTKSGVSNDNIGSHIVGHPSIPLIGEFDKNINISKGTPSTVFLDKPGYILESTSASPAYGAVMIPGSGQDVFDNLKNYQKMAGFGVMLVDDSKRANRVYLDSHGKPQISYELTKSDKERFRAAVVDAVRIMFKAGAKKVIIPTNENILGRGVGSKAYITSIEEADKIIDNLHFVPNKTIITSAHLQSSARMGSSASNSVVNYDQKVWGKEGLYVADSSIHPTSVGANPMQSIYTFAKLFVDKIE